jgi:uncharacterized protein (UPF0335 family)
MGRRRKTAHEAMEAAEEHLHGRPAPAIGGNVSDDTARRHMSAISILEAELANVRQKLKTAWDAAEADGIDKKAFKAVMKLRKEDPAKADAYTRLFQRYSEQLGLFDMIDAWKQAEETEANGASIDAAERELADA